MVGGSCTGLLGEVGLVQVLNDGLDGLDGAIGLEVSTDEELARLRRRSEY